MSTIAARLGELYQRSPFWRERWRDAGLSSAPEGLDGLPVVTPQELALDEERHPPFGGWRSNTELVRTGWPVRSSPIEAVFFTAADLEREARVGARALERAGLRPGMRETNTLPGGLATPGSLIVGDAAQHLGALDMPVGPLTAAAARGLAFDFWSRVRPAFAILDVAGASDLLGLLDERKATARGIGLMAAAIVTDLRDPEPELPDLGVPVRRIVGMFEAFSLLAARDDDGAFYPPPDELIVEVIDGELVLTTLAHSAALIRYVPGVRARLVRDRAERRDVDRPGFVLG